MLAVILSIALVTSAQVQANPVLLPCSLIMCNSVFQPFSDFLWPFGLETIQSETERALSDLFGPPRTIDFEFSNIFNKVNKIFSDTINFVDKIWESTGPYSYLYVEYPGNLTGPEDDVNSTQCKRAVIHLINNATNASTHALIGIPKILYVHYGHMNGTDKVFNDLHQKLNNVLQHISLVGPLSIWGSLDPISVAGSVNCNNYYTICEKNGFLDNAVLQLKNTLDRMKNCSEEKIKLGGA